MAGRRLEPSPSTLHSPSAHPAPPLADFKVGVDNTIFAFDGDRQTLLVLLVKRRSDPFAGQWSLPGTLVRVGESLEAAAYRVLREKVQVHNAYLEQLYTFGGPDRDPREAADSFGIRYLSVSYFALVRHGDASPTNGDGHGDSSSDGDSALIRWHPFTNLPPLAFDHDRIVRYGHQRLRNKLEYSPIAFDVLPETFTLSDLYRLYQIVLGDQFSDYSNFRTRLLKLGFLCDTGSKAHRGAGRPASLYRFDAKAFEPLRDRPLVFV